MELQEKKKNRTEQKTDMQNKEKALLTQLDGFCAGIAEMDMNLVGCLSDFLYHRRRVFRRSGRSSGV